MKEISTLTKIRIWLTSVRYSFWLDWYNIKYSKQKQLERELRSNLENATKKVGYKKAVKNLGSLKQLAADMKETETTKPRWLIGLGMSFVAFIVTNIIIMMAAAFFMQGVRATDAKGQISADLFPFPDAEVTASNEQLSFGFTSGWLPFAVAAATFILAAKPWKLLTNRNTEKTELNGSV